MGQNKLKLETYIDNKTRVDDSSNLSIYSVRSQIQVKVLPSPFSVKGAAPISVSLACGPHSCAMLLSGAGHLAALFVSLHSRVLSRSAGC